MTYTKTNWRDQLVERPKTYEVTNNQDGSITLTDSFGLVTELGTPVNAVNMNHIEDGLALCDLTQYSASVTYNQGEWVTGVVNNTKGIYASKVDDNLNNPLSDADYWEAVSIGGGASRNIGEIVASTLPLVDAGLHLLDGALIQGNGIYGDFVSYIADLYTDDPSANYFITESDWQDSVTDYGVCAKFVYDSVNNTVRLPKITGLVEGTTDVNALGDLIEQFVRLPNITGNIGTWASYSGPTGAFYNVYTGTGYDGGGLGTNQVMMDASRISSVYSGDGTNTKIQPQAIKAFYYIVIATSTKTEIEADIDEIATDLNGKADLDLTNTSASLSNSFLAKLMPDYANAIAISSVPYTAPCAGVCDISVSGSDIQILVNNVIVARDGIYQQGSSSRIFLDKNDVITTSNGALDTVSNYQSKFFPLKGVN